MDRARSALRDERLDATDRRGAAAIGRHARLDLVFEYRRGRTVLTHGYAEPPFRIGRSFEAAGAAYLIVVCYGPGLFGGDRLHQSVRVGRGARVALASQSALQVHPAVPSTTVRTALGAGVEADPAGVALAASRFVVADEGELLCHWDPVIPFAGARLNTRIDVRIARSSRLYWSDAVMSGRAGRGEAWMFSEWDHELRLTIDESLEYLERYCLTPADRPIRHPWSAGDANYLGTAIVHDPSAETMTGGSVAALQAQLDAMAGLRAGVDRLSPYLTLGRLMAARGPQFSAGRACLRQWALERVFGISHLAFRRDALCDSR